MTDNHGLNTPSQGTENWHEPLNENFEQLDIAVEIRDVAANRDDFTPKQGAKFLELDTGVIHVGDGESWVPGLSMGYFEDGELVCGELSSCIEAEPSEVECETPREFGVNAHAVHQGAIVFGDATGTSTWSRQSNEIRSQMPIYAPSFNTTSARAAKTDIHEVNPEDALAGVEQLPIRSWRFRDGDSAKHIGPMAEDFHEQFPLGEDGGSIASVDADGVALAAIQALSSAVTEQSERIDTLEQENEELHNRTDELARRLEMLEHHIVASEGNSA